MRPVAKKSDWDIENMPDRNESFILERHFTDEETEVLKYGNIPQEMEDKWFWYCEDGRLYAHRSWTGICVFIIEFDFVTDRHKVTVNRDREQYGGTDTAGDREMINGLLDWWVQPKYDYYGQWIDETLNAIGGTEDDEEK